MAGQERIHWSAGLFSRIWGVVCVTALILIPVFCLLVFVFGDGNLWNAGDTSHPPSYIPPPPPSHIPPPLDNSCPIDFDAVEDSCYLLQTDSRNRMESFKFCENRDSRLVRILNENQQKTIERYLNEKEEIDGGDVWIALRLINNDDDDDVDVFASGSGDFYDQENETWTWDDGSKVEFTNWSSDYSTDKIRKCAVLSRKREWAWLPTDCLGVTNHSVTRDIFSLCEKTRPIN